MGAPYDEPDPRDRDRDPQGRRRPGPPEPPPPPRGRAQVPPPPERRRSGPPPQDPPRARPRPYDDDEPRPDDRRPSSIGRASVRSSAGRDPGPPQDPFDVEPVSGVARVGDDASRGGRHAARGLLPGGLSIRRGIRLRGRLLSTTFALLLVLMGSGVVGGSYFLDSVQLSSELNFPATTTLYYSNGHIMASLGESTRYPVPLDHVSDYVKVAIVASEDQSFWTNEGVDVSGVFRAAWNNFTGGRTQGASTITQQYARLAYELSGVTYQRKLKEAVLAWKMSQTMEKREILDAYLNAVSFGRQANGVEAAAWAFFDKSADNTYPDPNRQITFAEAIVLVAMVKQPYPDPNDPVGSPGYDPTVSDAASVNAHNRFDYVKQQLLTNPTLFANTSITRDQVEALAFPETVMPYQPKDNGRDGPQGHIVNQVLSELTHTDSEDSPFYGAKDWKYIEEGGYQIYTTIDEGAQWAARKAASRTGDGTVMNNQPQKLQAALVAVQPGTGRVIAYYGGDNGIGSDFAGTYLDQNDDVLGVGAHPPGSSFKVYTLAAALQAGVSLKSFWRWDPHDMEGRTGSNQIKNSADCGDVPSDQPCSLLDSLIHSINVPFYQLGLTTKTANVLQTARDLGINAMYNLNGERVDLTGVTDMNTVVPSQFDNMLAIGMYPVTVLDHANALATIASAGVRAQAHFVERVVKGGNVIYGETLPAGDVQRVLSPTTVNDLTYAMSQVPAADTNIGWDTAGKTGTWEWGQNKSENAHAWMVGFDRRLAVAVWVGNQGDEDKLRDANGNKIYGSGLPATIWRQFMGDATNALNEPRENTKFNEPNYAGNTMPDGAEPSPEPTVEQPGNGGGNNCRIPIFCPPNN